MPGRVAAVAAEVLEVDLVVLDPADRERQIDLERPELGVDLVGAREIDAVELAEDLVPLVDVPLVELVVRLDGLPRDAVELQERRLQFAWGDFLVVVGKRHVSPRSYARVRRGAYPPEEKRTEGEACPTSSPVSRTRTMRSSRRSTRRRCRSTTGSTTRPTSTTSTRPSKAPSGTASRSSRCSASSTRSPRTSRGRSATTAAATRTTRSSGRS